MKSETARRKRAIHPASDACYHPAHAPRQQSRLQSPDLELIEAILKPGMDGRSRRHTGERETFMVLEGEVQVWLEGRQSVLKVGDTLSIPPLALRRFGNN